MFNTYYNIPFIPKDIAYIYIPTTRDKVPVQESTFPIHGVRS